MQFNIPTEYKDYHELNEQELEEYTRAMEISNKAIKLCIEEPDDQELEKKFKTLVAYLKCKEYIK